MQHPDTHTEEITEEFRNRFLAKGGCTIVLHHETVPIGVFKTVHTNGDYTLNLCDVDPSSIKTDTYDFHKAFGNCAEPEEVRSYDLDCSSAEVEFHIRNEDPKIKDDFVTTFDELAGKEHEAQGHSYASKGSFIVDDATYAKRFAKAFKHAVELCGGKASKF